MYGNHWTVIKVLLADIIPIVNSIIVIVTTILTAFGIYKLQCVVFKALSKTSRSILKSNGVDNSITPYKDDI